jgi:dTDP-4-amino-4,6-dideoxygalactose transaminase
MKVPYLSFAYMNNLIRAQMMDAFGQVFERQNYILGDQVKLFEQAYAQFTKTAYCVGVSNGLDALRLCMEILNIGPGDEVLVPSNTYIATVLAITQAGADPVFAEPDPLTYNINPIEIEARITSKTKAILPVHLYGQACEMKAIMDIANRNNLWVIEDNAQAQGATYMGKFTGAWGHLNATSFFPTKNLGALGDAGALTTQNADWKDQAMLYRNYGSSSKYCNEIPGFNMRLDELQAAFLNIKLPYLLSWNQQKQAIADRYAAGLDGLGDLRLPKLAPEATHVYHIYLIRTCYRNELQAFLSDRGIGTLVHYPTPPYLQPAYASLGYRNGDFPIAEEIADTCISLPIWPGMSDTDIELVIDSIGLFFRSKAFKN